MPNNNSLQDKALHWLGMEAPRYTSYPSAHHFSSQVNESVYHQWLGAINKNANISAYIHIPFCRELCWFCGCHTKMTKRYEPVAKYTQTLLSEIALLKNYTGGEGELVNIHFGGGSPSLLAAGDLMSILYALADSFGTKPSGEVAIELDPRTTTAENISLYGKLGFNRVSLGIQDFDDRVQQAINRVQPYLLVETIMQQLRETGISQINCDLIYGLPHQTMESFRTTLEKTIGLQPSRVALFSYAHMPSAKKHQRLINSAALPSEHKKLELYIAAQEMLEAAGYITIGIDHFAKVDDPLTIAMQNRTLKRNFQGYVTDAADALIGFGSSAISQLPQGYVQNHVVAANYRNAIAEGKLPVARGWKFGSEDILRKNIVDGLMCFMSADVDENHFKPEIEELQKPEYREIVSYTNGRITITTKYRMAARVVAAVFDQYRAVAAGRYSKVA